MYLALNDKAEENLQDEGQVHPNFQEDEEAMLRKFEATHSRHFPNKECQVEHDMDGDEDRVCARKEEGPGERRHTLELARGRLVLEVKRAARLAHFVRKIPLIIPHYASRREEDEQETYGVARQAGGLKDEGGRRSTTQKSAVGARDRSQRNQK